MKVNCTIVRYDDIGLKSSPVRREFEELLINNIHKLIGKSKIVRIRGRIIVYSTKINKIKNVFGISSISPAFETSNNFENLKKTALKYYSSGTFRITTQRVNKKYQLSSQEVSQKIGYYIVKQTGAKVKLKNPDINIHIELIKNKAYFFTEKIKGFGGLPVSSQGKVMTILDSEKSIYATLMVMNRGCYPLCVGNKKYYQKLKKLVPHLNLQFYSEEQALKKAKAIISSKELSSIKKMRKKYSLPVLYPLIGISLSKIRKKFTQN